MNLYIAGLINSHFHLAGNLFRKLSDNGKLLRLNVSRQLESYHYLKKGASQVKNLRAEGRQIFLDSGAFSAFSLGVEIDIGEYAEFIKENQEWIEMASVLDAIGDYKATYENQMELERRGCAVLPCFHFGEPFDLCRWYASNYEYITIGGMVPIPNDKLEPWLDQVWEKCLTDKDGYATTKVHGFGLTARNLMVKYPWYSVDSSSWVQAASNGAIVLPEFTRVIPISARSPNVHKFNGHFDSMPEISKQRVLDALTYYGLTLEEVRDDYKGRWALNAFAFDMLGKQLGDDHWRKPFKAAQGVLFDA